MKIAVTGATGHVGANLVRTLVAAGHQVRALVHGSNRRGLDGVAAEVVEGDVLDAASLRRAFDGCERVFHLAARISILPGDEEKVRAVNVDGTQNVVESCLATKVRRLVHFSSIHALSPLPRDVAIDETRALTSSPHMPPYDRSKAAAEEKVRAGIARGLDAVVVNPTAILGPFDYGPSRMGQVLLDLYHQRLPALVDGGFDWVDVRDVVAGALAAADGAPSGERYLLSGERRTVAELAGLVGEITGVRPPRLVSPMWLARVGAPFATAAARIVGKEPLYTRHSLHALRNHQLVSHAKATRDLGYRPRPLVETLSAAYDWFRQSGALDAARA
jgi:dihydroflavonol-4-reductase